METSNRSFLVYLQYKYDCDNQTNFESAHNCIDEPTRGNVRTQDNIRNVSIS